MVLIPILPILPHHVSFSFSLPCRRNAPQRLILGQCAVGASPRPTATWNKAQLEFVAAAAAAAAAVPLVVVVVVVVVVVPLVVVVVVVVVVVFAVDHHDDRLVYP